MSYYFLDSILRLCVGISIDFYSTLDQEKQRQEHTQKKTWYTLNELLVGLFNYILHIEANKIKSL